MSYSGGWQTGQNGAPSFNFQDMLSQGTQALNSIGGTVGAGEKPEYNFPSGIDKLPESVRTWFLRSDNGQTGLNEFLRNADPKVIDEFRSAVNSGLIQPKNAAADQIIKGYGGLRAGDMAGPGGILGPMQDDMPSGLSPEYWQQANTLIGTMIDAQMKAAEASGYFNGIPTIQREQIMGQLAQGWKQQFTNEFLANEQKRASMAQEGMTQQQINNQNLQSMAQIMGGTVNPQTGQFQQTEQGRQFDTSQTGYINGQRTLAGEAQDWSMQKDVANAAANPRDYIYAQMLGNARGGLAGQPATNQLQMPSRDGMGAPGAAQNAWNPANYNASTGQLGVGNAGQNPLASTQPPGTSGAGTMAQNGTPGQPSQGASQWQDMYEKAMGAQDQARQAMMGAQAGAGAGAASALSPGAGSMEMVRGWTGYQGQDGQGTPQPTPGQPGQEGMASISPVNPATGMRFDESTGQYTSQPLPTAQQNYDRRMALMGGLPQGVQAIPEGGMQGLQPFQAPGGMQKPVPGQTPGMPQPQQGQSQPQYTTSAFTQQLLKNRMVPGQGAIQGQGQYMTQQQMQKSVMPNKIRAQDFLRGRDSEQKGFLGTTSAAGFSDEDAIGAIKNNMPKFQAPGAGRMI